jgi:hypothetical protein
MLEPYQVWQNAGIPSALQATRRPRSFHSGAFLSPYIIRGLLLAGVSCVLAGSTLRAADCNGNDVPDALDLTAEPSFFAQEFDSVDIPFAITIIKRINGEIRLYWERVGTLERNSRLVGGAWIPVPVAASPWTIQPTNSPEFFRLRMGE